MPKADQDQTKILSQNLFPVVGIGASAGGLDAFRKLIQAIPENSGMAYILVQHLAPEHASALPEILQRVTKIPVSEISNNVQVNRDHIYIIPPNKMLIATDGILKLSPRSGKGRLNLPIDIFFSSLAEVHQAHAIGVILSGNGADGTEGLRDIKDHGGLTIAQEPASGSSKGMPQHAIDADIVDFILAPEKIPEKLLSLQSSFNHSPTTNDPILNDITDKEFREILTLLRVQLGVDFSFYKQTTIQRRIIRRMQLLKLENLKSYVEYLKNTKSEPDTLFNDLLIPVTSFFRDTSTFDQVGKTIFPEILKRDKSANNPLRIWIAGCSTGQEAYSTAICLHELLNDHLSSIKIQIYATDISKQSIKKARLGIYSRKELDGISVERLSRFFNKIDGHYQVTKSIREICVFAVHDFLKDPPFAKMDMICCRNVMIYFEPYLQKKAITTFHYALNDKGILWLGKSETTGQASNLFIPMSKKEKFYTRKTSPGRFTSVTSGRNEIVYSEKNDLLKNKEIKTEDIQKSVDDILLSKYMPAGVVINEQMDIVQFRGSTGKYLEPSPGKASLNILKMAREGLSFEIRNALHKAKTTKRPVIKEGMMIDDGKLSVSIEVVLLPNTIDPYFLILFRSHYNAELHSKSVAGKGKSSLTKLQADEQANRVMQLEKELAQAREDMQSITEQQDAANEELQSSNEELLSNGEELQSLNEELETSKEELQSTNEELITVNQELYDSNTELHSSRKFADATIAVLHEPLLVLDKKYIIKSANSAFFKTFQLTEEETLGKIVFELQRKGWDIPGLRKELEKIQKEQEKLIEIEIAFDFPVIGKRLICFNIQPIMKENGEQLILLAMDDITERNRVTQLLKEKATGVLHERQMLHNFFMQTPALLCILKGPEHIFELANPLYQKYTGYRVLVGEKLLDALPELANQGFLELLDKVYSTGEPFIGTEMPLSLVNKKGKSEQRYINFNYQALKDEQGNTEGILVFAYDVTEQVIARRLLEQNAEMIQNLYMNAPGFIATLMGPTHIYTLVNPAYQKVFGKREIVGKPILIALPELVGQGFDLILDNVYQTGETFVGIEIPITLARDVDMEPEVRYFNFSYQPIYQEDKTINGILVFGYEVTEEILGKKIQEESAVRFQLLAESMPQKVWTADADGNINYFNEKWLEYTHKNYEELKAWGWKNIIHPDEWEVNQAAWEHSMATGEDFQVEHRYLRHDGNYRWHLSRALAQRDKDGKIIMWLGTNTDIHEQRLFAEELKKQIAERIKIENQKNDFISMASHELRTPVTSIKGYAQTIQRVLKNAESTGIDTYLVKMDRQVNKLNSLINDLLDASKVTQGKLKFNEEVFDFNELIVEIIDDMQQVSANHAIESNLAESAMITGDRNRIGQVMTNILSNAIKYSPKADRVIVSSALENKQIKFCVEDFGIGIPQDNLNKVFDQFFRIGGLGHESTSGLGLGLFIASEIIKRHEGTMEVESTEGKGSTFCFLIPVNEI